VLARHGGLGLGNHDVFVNVAGGVRVDEPAADLAVALALVSAARGVALGSVCAFGEIALTGRLRPVTQPERRLNEAARLGLEMAIVPEGAPGGSLRVRHAATLLAASELAIGVTDDELVPF
jgi:DNA repair protein RadA/Sms